MALSLFPCSSSRRTVETVYFLVSKSTALILFGMAFLLSSGTVCAQPQQGNDSPESGSVVVAMVGDHSIFQRQIDWEFKKKFLGKRIDETVAKKLRDQILTRLVNQYIVLDKFRGTAVYANDDEVKLQVDRLKESLKQIDKTLDDYLSENETKLEDLTFNLRWQTSWKRYVDKTLTDRVLENYYNRTPFRFDGTRLKVSHLLLKLDLPKDKVATPEQVEIAATKARQTLLELKTQIESNQVTWQAAVARHSKGSTAQKSGAIGEIGIDGPMPGTFTEAAFELKQGQISNPVVTPFGVHLVRCDEVLVGRRNWYDCKRELRQAATTELFDRVANKHRPNVSVRLLDRRAEGETSGQ